MKVSGSQVLPILGGYERSVRRPSVAAAQSDASGDQVQLSQEAQLVRDLQEKMKALPEVRGTAVERLKQGEYRPDSVAVAESLIRRGAV